MAQGETRDGRHQSAIDRAVQLERKRKQAAEAHKQRRDQAQRPTALSPLERLEQKIERKRGHFQALQAVQRRLTKPAPARAVLRVAGRITRKTANTFVAQLQANALAERVTVFIDSEGGDAFAAVGMHVALAAHPGEVETVARGLCASAAATVFAAGKRRRAGARAQFLLHESACEPRRDVRWTARQLEVHLKACREADAEGLACLTRACGRSEETIRVYLTDKPETAERMKTLGIVNQIDDPSPAGVGAVERGWIDGSLAEHRHRAGQRQPKTSGVDLTDTNAAFEWFGRKQREFVDLMRNSRATHNGPHLREGSVQWLDEVARLSGLAEQSARRTAATLLDNLDGHSGIKIGPKLRAVMGIAAAATHGRGSETLVAVQ